MAEKKEAKEVKDVEAKDVEEVKAKMCPILTAGLVAKQGILDEKWVSLLCRKADCEVWNVDHCGLRG